MMSGESQPTSPWWIDELAGFWGDSDYLITYDTRRAAKVACDQFATVEALRSERLFQLGDIVRKKSGSWWQGKVVGFYSTDQTPVGYCVQLIGVTNGPVQIYPESALEADDHG